MTVDLLYNSQTGNINAVRVARSAPWGRLEVIPPHILFRVRNVGSLAEAHSWCNPAEDHDTVAQWLPVLNPRPGGPAREWRSPVRIRHKNKRNLPRARIRQATALDPKYNARRGTRLDPRNMVRCTRAQFLPLLRVN